MTNSADPKLDTLIADIARRCFGAETLETQNTGDDFHEVAVWNLESALRAAFEAGRRAERED
jgi:hypothetical protein